MSLVITPNVTQIGETGDQVSGSVLLVEGSNMTITRSGQSITFASSGGGSSATQQSFTQAAHGFSVGNAISFHSGAYIKADSTDISKLGFLIVTAVAGANDFTAAQAGYYTTFSGLTADQYYFVDAATPGALTVTEPSFPNYSNPVLHAVSTTAAWILPFRPSLDGSIIDGGIFGETYDDTADGGTW